MGSFSGGSGKVDETELQKEEARIARDKFNYLRNERNQATETLIESTQQMNDERNYTRVANDTGAVVGQAFDDARDNLVDNMAANRVDPSSGKYKGTLQSLSVDEGSATADNKNRAGVGQQDRYVTGISGLVAQGEGESADAVSGISELASNSQRLARQDAADSLDKYNRRLGAGATLAGIGYAAQQEDDD